MILFAMIGVVNLILASAIVTVLPFALAIWIAPGWLWLYAVYAVLILIFALIANAFKQTEADEAEGRGEATRGKAADPAGRGSKDDMTITK